MFGRFKKISVFAAISTLALWAAPSAFAADNYTVKFTGSPEKLEDILQASSKLAAKDLNLPTRAAINRIAIQDKETLQTALTAAGYYANEVSFEVQSGAEDIKNFVTFSIVAGPLFSISDYVIRYDDTTATDRPTSLAELKLEANGSASGADLQAMQKQILEALWNNGYPAAKITGRRAEATLKDGSAKAVFTFESGPRAIFGDVELTGALRTEPDFLKKLRTWETGDKFERSKLVDYREKLAATGLFGAVDVAPGAPDSTGIAPVVVTVEERKRRTIGAGLSFSTSEGPGGRLFFEYRNVFGAGETARVEIEGSELEQAIQFNISKPLPDLPGEIFGQFGFTNETTDAFNARSLDIGAGVTKRWFDDRLTTRGGVAFETSRITSDGISERTYLLSLPVSYTHLTLPTICSV